MRSLVPLVSFLAACCLATTPSAQPYQVRDGVIAAERLYKRKDFAGALATLDRVLAKQPDDPVALAWRAEIYIELGDYRRALVDHDASLALAPKSPGALSNACWARVLAGVEFDRALTYCNLAIAVAPSLRTFDTRGFLHLKRGEFELAAADYDAAVRLARRVASPLYGRGLSRIKLGQVNVGEADVAAALKRDPTIAETYARRGWSAGRP